MPELSNPRAERVRALRALSGRSARRRAGRFLIEGPQAVREAVRAAGQGAAAAVPVRLRELVLTDEAAARHPEIAGLAAAAGVTIRTATPEVVGAISDDAQGVLASADLLTTDLAAVLVGRPRLVAVLAQVRDPGNAGTVIRSADAAGADAVVLVDGSVEVHNPKVVRSTAGSLFHLPVVTAPVAEALAALRVAGLQVLAADGRGEHDLDDLLDAVPVRAVDAAAVDGAAVEAGAVRVGEPARGVDVVAGPSAGSPGADVGIPDLTRPTAWLLGNEAWGLPDEVRDLADAVVRVPIRGAAESLNLATAAALCLYASARAQR